MRLFFAVDFSSAIKQLLQDAIEDIPVKNPPWRWVAPDNLHVTLKFLGDMDDDSVPGLCDCAAAVAEATAPFSIKLGGLGGFPTIENPRVLFYRFDAGIESLAAITDQLNRSLTQRCGMEPDRRPFKAHATIARIKTRIPDGIVRKLQAVPALEGASQPISDFMLMESKLSSQGARYQCLKAFALSKSK